MRREENSKILERDINQLRHYIVIDDETFQQTFVNKTSKGSLTISILVYLDTRYTFFSFTVFHTKSTFFPKK